MRFDARFRLRFGFEAGRRAGGKAGQVDEDSLRTWFVLGVREVCQNGHHRDCLEFMLLVCTPGSVCDDVLFCFAASSSF